MPFEALYTPAARTDLDDIWAYTVAKWGVDQAEVYLRGLGRAVETLRSNPSIARERKEFSPPVRIQRYGSHVIICRVEDRHLLIIRVVHVRRDWRSLLGG